MTAAAVVPFLIAAAVMAACSPFTAFVLPAGVSGLAGWAIYRQHSNGHDDGMEAADPSPANFEDPFKRQATTH